MDIGDAKLTLKVEGAEKVNAALGNVGQSLDKMSGTFRKAGLAMMAMGTAMATGLVAITKKWADAGDEVAKMATRTGASVEWLSKMRYAAEISGSSIEGLEKAFKRFAKTQDDAKQGMETSIREFDRLGINFNELKGMKPEDAFMKVALAISEIEDPLERAAAAQNMFGRSGAELLPLLDMGAAGIELLMQKAEDMGLVFTDKTAKAAEAFNDALKDLKSSLYGVGAQIAQTLAPILTDLMENKIVPLVEKIAEWIEKNPQLVKAIGILSVALIGAGGLLFALSLISKAIMAINTALIILHSLTGVGILKMLAGLAVAGAGIYGMTKFLEGAEVPATPETEISPEAKAKLNKMFEEAGRPELKFPGYQYGGIVPGPIGKPVPIIAHGGEPFGGIGRGFGNTYNITIQAGAFTGNEADARRFAEDIYDYILEKDRRTTGAIL